VRKVITVILDGFGYREEAYGNAIKMADTKNFDKLWNTYPHTTLHASEEYVGLNHGEFGLMIIFQPELRRGLEQLGTNKFSQFIGIDKSIEVKTKENIYRIVIAATELAKTKTIHIVGLYSDGNVHSNYNHFLKVYELLKENNAKNIHFHLITDGRDTKVNESVNYIQELEEIIKDDPNTDIASICGRYYAMDRDTNYERTKVYYDLITKGIGIEAKNATNGILALYKKNITDEFLYPIILNKDALIKDGDIVLWMNYRSDRGKQIIKSLTSKNFPDFPTYEFNNLTVYSFFNVDKGIKTITFLEDIKINNALGLFLWWNV